MRRISAVFIAFVVSVTFSNAQTRQTISASAICDRSLLHQAAVVGDEGQHSISLDQRICTWKPAIILAGMKSTEYTATGTDDIQFDSSRDRGYGVGAVEDGYKYFLSYDGTSMMNGPIPIHLDGTWRFTGGTGRLAGLLGSGTYGATPTPDGRMAFEIKGDYVLPEKSGK